MYRFSERSLSNLVGVHPELVQLMHDVLAESPHDFMITCGVRTMEVQDQMVREGKSRTRKSKHLPQEDGYAHAVDIAVLAKGKVTWDFRYYEEVAEVAKRLAGERGLCITWGGEWVTLRDGPHFQLEAVA